MGLLKRIFAKNKQHLDINITATIVEDAAREKELEPLKRQWEMERAEKRQPYISDIPYLIPGLNFDKDVCYAEVFPHYDKKSDDNIQSEPLYYANSHIVEAIIPIINEIECLIEPAYKAIPSLPLLKTETELIIPINSLSDIPALDEDRNMVGISIHPLTPKGKSARYPVSVLVSGQKTHWEREDGMSFMITDGSHGTLCFLPDGRVGKADMHYWHGHIRHTASFRMHNNRLLLTKLVYQNLKDDRGTQALYLLSK